MTKEKLLEIVDRLEKFVKSQSKHYAFKQYSREPLLNFVSELRGEINQMP